MKYLYFYRSYGFLNIFFLNTLKVGILYLNTFYSVLAFLYFYIFIQLPISILIIIIVVMIIFVIVFVIVIVIIISSFSKLLTVILLLFYFCICRIFLNFKQITWRKHCSKLVLKILRLYQCL